MTFERRHLNIAIAVLVLVIAWNLWSWLRPSAPMQAQADAPLLGPEAAPAGRAAAGGPARPAFDATSIPAPVGVDLRTPPIWSRDPLLAPGESRKKQAAVLLTSAPVGPDPTLRTILHSAERSLAIVDNRIVRVGDVVSVGTIVEIQRDAIVVQTASGERRRIGLYRGPSLQGRMR
jgi:hypothetical protein